MAGSMSAMQSSEQANLTAPLQSPSSSFADTRAARDLIGSLWGGVQGGLGTGVLGGSTSSDICLFRADVNYPGRPWLEGNLRQWDPNRRRRSQEAQSLWDTTASRMDASFFAAKSLSSF